jgi:hypothetical protein
MIGLARRMARSRAAGKFWRNRLAVFSLAVILLYVLIGVGGFVGVFTPADALDRAGPDSLNGWAERQTPEKRLRDAKFYREMAERVLRRQDYEGAVREATLFERALAPLSKDELKARVKASDDLYNTVADRFDEATEARLKLDEVRKKPPPDPKAEGEALAAQHKAEADAEASLGELESVTASLFPVPDGWKGFEYRFRTFLGTDRQGRSISMRAL